MQYEEDGFLPAAVINYLARLGWSHGDAEIFSVAQFCEWFDLDHITPSAAQFNTDKLLWLNQHYLKGADTTDLAAEVARRLRARSVATAPGPRIEGVVELYKERVATLNELADAAEPFYVEIEPAVDLLLQHVTDQVRPALQDLKRRFGEVAWERAQLSRTLKEAAAAHGLKMPQVAIPLRVLILGQPQTPSIDAVLEALGRDLVVARMSRHV